MRSRRAAPKIRPLIYGSRKPAFGSRLRAIAARLMSRLAFERSVAFSLIQSRSSD
jgi:hypothetical protein